MIGGKRSFDHAVAFRHEHMGHVATRQLPLLAQRVVAHTEKHLNPLVVRVVDDDLDHAWSAATSSSKVAASISALVGRW